MSKIPYKTKSDDGIPGLSKWFNNFSLIKLISFYFKWVLQNLNILNKRTSQSKHSQTMLTRPCYFVNDNNADNFNKWLKELEFKKLVF